MSIWDDDGSKYGTYDDSKGRGNPNEWASTFGFVFENSASVQAILGMNSYSILGVPPSATDIEIKKVYIQLSRKYHPNSHVDDAEPNEEKWRQVKAAYDMINNLRHPTVANTDPDVVIVTRTPSQPVQPPRQHFDYANADLIIPQLLTPITEDQVDTYLDNLDYGCQEKKDGKHLTLQIKDGNLIVRNKKGIACGCAPEFESSLRAIGCDIFIDGEQIGDKFWVWDILEYEGKDLRDWAYLSRYMKLSKLSFGNAIKILKLAISPEDKRALYEELKANGKEGIVFKNMSAPFTPGKGQDQFKLKFYADCSVIVVAGRENRASIGMELINDQGEREFVGYCSCSRNPPIGSVVDIKYLYAYRGGCLYQPAFKGPRDDVNVEECTTSQLKYKSEEE